MLSLLFEFKKWFETWIGVQTLICIESEIRTAVNQGLTVTTHTDNISVPEWTGAGYLIIDPEIMDGSYKISGGTNGGSLGFLNVLSVCPPSLFRMI